MMRKKKLKNRLYICLILAAVLVIFGLGLYIYKGTAEYRSQSRLTRQNKKELKEWSASFGEIVEKRLRKESEVFSYYKDAEIEAHADWSTEEIKRVKYRVLTDTIHVTLKANSTFLMLSDFGIRNWLEWESREYGKRIQNVYDNYLSDYMDLIRYFDLEKSTSYLSEGQAIIYVQKFEYSIKAGYNTYRYFDSDDGYFLNDRLCFVEKEKPARKPTKTPTPTPTPKSSSGSGQKSSGSSSGKSSGKNSGKGFDYYDTYEYDDPEDFYYDYEDDFEDYEDAEDYWEEYH